MKNLDEKELLEELRRVPWDSAYIFEDVDDLWDYWAKLYCQLVLDKHAPLKEKRIKMISYHGLLPNYNVKFLGEIV